MSPYDIKELKILNTLQGMTLYQLDFERGLRLIADRFIIHLVDREKEVIIEGKENFRVRDDEKMYLAFNDLYTEKSRKKEQINSALSLLCYSDSSASLMSPERPFETRSYISYPP